MRDPARIDRIIELLRQAWHVAPDQRLGQLMENVLQTVDRPQSLWAVEDDRTERKLQAFLAHGTDTARAFDAAQRTK